MNRIPKTAQEIKEYKALLDKLEAERIPNEYDDDDYIHSVPND